MSNSSKRKGDTEERAVVNLMRSLGFKCLRTLESGARSDGSATWDIDLYARGNDEAPLIGECKARQRYKLVYDDLGENDFLTVRMDRKDRIYIFPEHVALKLLLALKDKGGAVIVEVVK